MCIVRARAGRQAEETPTNSRQHTYGSSASQLTKISHRVILSAYPDHPRELLVGDAHFLIASPENFASIGHGRHDARELWGDLQQLPCVGRRGRHPGLDGTCGIGQGEGDVISNSYSRGQAGSGDKMRHMLWGQSAICGNEWRGISGRGGPWVPTYSVGV